jgi:hypothetical protein
MMKVGRKGWSRALDSKGSRFQASNSQATVPFNVASKTRFPKPRLAVTMGKLNLGVFWVLWMDGLALTLVDVSQMLRVPEPSLVRLTLPLLLAYAGRS